MAAFSVVGSKLRHMPATAPFSRECAGRRCVISDLAPPCPFSVAAGICMQYCNVSGTRHKLETCVSLMAYSETCNNLSAVVPFIALNLLLHDR